eukprot:scaffold329439_cov34-Prasinocladus_malaysianus.AAC.1
MPAAAFGFAGARTRNRAFPRPVWCSSTSEVEIGRAGELSWWRDSTGLLAGAAFTSGAKFTVLRLSCSFTDGVETVVACDVGSGA